MPNMGLPWWEIKPFIYNILLNFKVLRSKWVGCKPGIIFLFRCQYENFELERDNIAGGRNKALKLPLTKLWETEAIGSIPKIRNFQKAIRKVYLRKSSALSFYRTAIVVENRV